MQNTKSIHKDPLHFITLIINNELEQRGIKKKIPVTIAWKRIKYPGIKLNQNVKNFYIENCKTLFKEINDTNKGLCAHELEELLLLKCPPKAI